MLRLTHVSGEITGDEARRLLDVIDEMRLTLQIYFFVTQVFGQQVRQKFATDVNTSACMPYGHPAEKRHDRCE